MYKKKKEKKALLFVYLKRKVIILQCSLNLKFYNCDGDSLFVFKLLLLLTWLKFVAVNVLPLWPLSKSSSSSIVVSEYFGTAVGLYFGGNKEFVLN